MFGTESPAPLGVSIPSRAIRAGLLSVHATDIRAYAEKHEHRLFVVAGGVGANRLLRARLEDGVRRLGAAVYFPPLELCTDNGAMIAFAAALKFPAGRVGDDDFAIHPRWDLAAAARETQSTPRR